MKKILSKKNIGWYFLFACVLVLVLYAILPDSSTDVSSWQGRVEIENGTEHVYNVDEPVYGEMSLSREDRLLSFPDVENQGQDSPNLAYPLDIYVNARHDVAIIDNVVTKIIVLDSSFNVVRAYGDSEGKGPREFSVAYSIYLTNERTAIIADFRNRRIQLFFVDDSTFVHNITVPGQIVGLTKNSEENEYFVLTRFAPERIWRFNEDFSAEVIYKEKKMVSFSDHIAYTVQNENKLTFTSRKELLFAYKYKPLFVSMSRDGKTKRLIHYIPSYSKKGEVLSGDLHGSGDQHKYISMSVVCQDIVSDEFANIFILTRNSKAEDDYAILCFDPSGRYLQKIFLPPGDYQSLFLRDGLLYLLSLGSNDSMYPKVEKYLLRLSFHRPDKN